MGWVTPSDVLNQGTTTAALQSEQHTQTHTAKAPTHLQCPGRGGHVESSLCAAGLTSTLTMIGSRSYLGDSKAKTVSSSARQKVPPFRLRNRGGSGE
jgi:hypothetical protein